MLEVIAFHFSRILKEILNPIDIERLTNKVGATQNLAYHASTAENLTQLIKTKVDYY